MGHAVPMPVVIRTRNYDEDFYAQVIKGGVTGTLVDNAREKLGNRGSDRRMR